jgi:diguanylate cyclase (GGDEF)-like protein
MLLANFVAVLFVLVSYRPELKRATYAARASQLAFTGMLDQETGLRGYLLTGERQFLQPYVVGQSEVRSGNTAILSVGMHGDAGTEILEVQLAEELWETTWASVAAGGTIGPTTSQAKLSAFLVQGKRLFDADRVQQAKLDAILNGQQNSATRAETNALLASVCLAALLFVWLAVVMRRQREILSAAIIRPVGEVLERIDRIRDGDLGVRGPIEGPTELQQVGIGLDSMAERLEAGHTLVLERERELAEYAGDLGTILRAAREVAGSFNLDYVLDAVASAAAAITRMPRAVVWLSEEDRLVPKHDTRADYPRQPDLPSQQAGYGRVGQAARFGRSVASGELAEAPEGEEVAMAVPMVVGGHVVGVIDVIGPSGSELPSQRLQALETLATHAATAVEAARLHSATERLTRTDALTQLANRRQLATDLSSEVKRSARYSRPLALIMLDVDHFKRFNDNHGHQRGDEILALFASVLSDELRSTDTAYRYGGEEFCVLVREGTEDTARLLAERIRQRIEQRMRAKGSHLTASFGVAQLALGMETSGLVELADAAMYRAKASGRNRVVVAGEQTETVGDVRAALTISRAPLRQRRPHHAI